MKKALFSVSAEDFNAHHSKLSGLDYEATTTADGKTTFVVVRDSRMYVGDPIGYVAQLFNQKAVSSCC